MNVFQFILILLYLHCKTWAYLSLNVRTRTSGNINKGEMRKIRGLARLRVEVSSDGMRFASARKKQKKWLSYFLISPYLVNFFSVTSSSSGIMSAASTLVVNLSSILTTSVRGTNMALCFRLELTKNLDCRISCGILTWVIGFRVGTWVPSLFVLSTHIVWDSEIRAISPPLFW